MIGDIGEDPFSGIWMFRSEKSRLSSPLPRTWIRSIEASGDELRVREEIVDAAGKLVTSTVEARFDGQDYALRDTPWADAIAYERKDLYTIWGTGKRHGSVCMKELIIAFPEGTGCTCALFMLFSILWPDGERTNGSAWFERRAASD